MHVYTHVHTQCIDAEATTPLVARRCCRRITRRLWNSLLELPTAPDGTGMGMTWDRREWRVARDGDGAGEGTGTVEKRPSNQR